MKILVRSDGNERWAKVDAHAYDKEAKLQGLLAKSPDLIPVDALGDDRKPICLAIPEAGLPGSGHSDLIGLDEDGNILIVETKLAANSEIKRKVIGQILEYAAYLWQKSYDEFDALVEVRLGKSLLQLMADMEKEDDEWSPDDFQASVAENLRNGNFALFIVVDEINEELRRIIHFLNSKGPAGFNLYALEIKHFKAKSAEIVLPQVYGVPQPRSSARSQLAMWDDSRFRKDAQSRITDPKAHATFFDLYEFVLTQADQQKWGRGKDAGRVAFRIRHPEARDGHVTLFRLRSDGAMKMGFGRMARELLPPAAEEAIAQLLKYLALPGIEKWYREVYAGKDTGWPGGNRKVNQVLPDPPALENFKRGILAFKKVVQG